MTVSSVSSLTEIYRVDAQPKLSPVSICIVCLTFSDPTDVEIIGGVGWVDDVGRITTVKFPYLTG